MQIEVDDYNISYRITGSGDKTVVMLQGWGTEFGIYDSVADAINDKYTFVQFDFPGFGASDEPREPWDVDAYADFFLHFMQALNIEKASLIGHSYGGRVIIKLASRDIPFEIENIVLVDSAGIVPQKTLSQRFRIRSYKILKKIFDVKAVYTLFPELVEDWKSRQGSADYQNASPVMRRCLVLAVNEDLRHLLPNIRQDTLLIWGRDDTATPLSDAKLMESMLPNCGLVVLDSCGHYSFLEQPVLFRSILRSYFRIGAEQ